MGVASLDLDRPGWRFLMASRNTNPGQMFHAAPRPSTWCKYVFIEYCAVLH